MSLISFDNINSWQDFKSYDIQKFLNKYLLKSDS